mmetsp:Transcript_24975/g.34424  ORF Transcript_24975/g.34424 Transcript_24975/m.34424 type:complete len:152 (+) Transcript_24975:117-572(+)|eukprot:CAMPEP_0196570400 /NCGR_PEP_ID=MMETSP1081-20130531/472_1 /TAXON_ID=36882 /ORGANISM="Pyramimonas amylifera, Strain CCMP720" /LENGTH=151 /DNA_ID=CAMNT_0041886817 /DNA_START=117 /DNA_END=572 /DNA_ORIENTATION=+
MPPKAKKDDAKSPKFSPKTKSKTSTVVKGTNQVAKVAKKVYELSGQKRDPPDETDSLRKFYVSLRTQRPDSEMAEVYLMEHGLLPKDEAEKAFKKKLKQKSGGASAKPVQNKVVKKEDKKVVVKRRNLPQSSGDEDSDDEPIMKKKQKKGR